MMLKSNTTVAECGLPGMNKTRVLPVCHHGGGSESFSPQRTETSANSSTIQPLHPLDDAPNFIHPQLLTEVSVRCIIDQTNRYFGRLRPQLHQ